jgi:hypothetical protein
MQSSFALATNTTHIFSITGAGVRLALTCNTFSEQCTIFPGDKLRFEFHLIVVLVLLLRQFNQLVNLLKATLTEILIDKIAVVFKGRVFRLEVERNYISLGVLGDNRVFSYVLGHFVQLAHIHFNIACFITIFGSYFSCLGD